MGSRYDIALFTGVTIDAFAAAISDRYAVAGRVEGPWRSPDAAIAAIEVRGRSAVVVASAPMKTPRGIDTRLARRLGATECAFATVWDSVSTYELTVVGDGVDRTLTVESDLDDEAQEPVRTASGAPLPEEPAAADLDESFIQIVLIGRYGVDPGNLVSVGEWYAIEKNVTG